MNALQVSGLHKSFRTGWGQKKEVLKQVSFTVPTGQISGFVGGNGSGKTTTIKSLLRFIFPDHHRKTQLAFFGQDKFTTDVRSRIAYLPERPYLPEHLRAGEFLRLHWGLSGRRKTTGSDGTKEGQAVLERLHLPDVWNRPLRHFSKGMLQRLGLAQALLTEADLLILDEPMSGLDPDGRWLVKSILRQENQRGATIFFSSHLLADMDELCSHLVIIDQGQIPFCGSVTDFVQASQPAMRLTWQNQQGQIHEQQVSAAELQKQILQIYQDKGEILKVVPEQSTIEAVFAQRGWTPQ